MAAEQVPAAPGALIAHEGPVRATRGNSLTLLLPLFPKLPASHFSMPLNKTPWTDDTVMPWGPHKGKKLRDLPGDHLQWLNEQRWIVDWPGLRSWLRTPAVQERIKRHLAAQSKDDTVPDAYRSFDDYLKDWR